MACSEEEFNERYFRELNRIVDLTGKLIDSYRILIGSASQLNTIGLAEKRSIKKTLELSDSMADVIDDYIEAIDSCGGGYLDYFCMNMKVYKKLAPANVVCRTKNCVNSLSDCLCPTPESPRCKNCNCNPANIASEKVAGIAGEEAKNEEKK